MNISKQQLRTIIIEEIELALKERCHDPSTGFFEKCKEGSSIYSQTKGSKRYSSEYDGRGTYQGRTKEGKPKLSAKYGSNGKEKDSAGRLVYNTGKEISNPKYYAGNRYKKKYLEEISLALANWVKSQDGQHREREINEDNDCNCSIEKKQAYQQGLRAALQFIQEYETAAKGKQA